MTSLAETATEEVEALVSSEQRRPAARPTWVSDDLIARWTSLIARSSGGAGQDHEVVEPEAPYDQSTVARVPVSTVADVADAAAAGRVAQAAWATLPMGTRADVLLRFHDLLVERQDEVLDIIQWEMGKARFSAWQEVVQVANLARHYARRSAAYLSDHRVRGAIPGAIAGREVRVPKGLIGMISPWNYPLYLGVGDVLPALMAGNAVLSKADSQTPLTLLWTRALLLEAGLPGDCWQVVVGAGRVVGTALIDEADHICFTGSTQVGRGVGARAGERLIAASLELGGKNPLIVRADADLDKAVAGTVTAAFANTGQMCIHIERVIVHQDVYAEFRDKLVAAVRSLTIGQAFDYSVDVGSLATQAQLDVVTEHVETARAAGAVVLVGGQARPDLGPYCYEPTVLEGVTADMPVCGDETFGPVISLYEVASDAEAIARANEGTFGLSASIFSRDTRKADTLASSIRAGSVSINDGAGAAAGSIEAGMGGMGDSGLGRRHGAEGIRKYTESQTHAIQRFGSLNPPASLSLERFVKLGNGQLALLRRLWVR